MAHSVKLYYVKLKFENNVKAQLVNTVFVDLFLSSMFTKASRKNIRRVAMGFVEGRLR